MPLGRKGHAKTVPPAQSPALRFSLDCEHMATTRTSKSTLSQMVPEPEVAAVPSLVLRAFDEVYHFLASVKLAVICIATLAMVLAAATIFESAYGIPASREYFYGHKAFAILLGFLATNIFCAATIRIPWKKRQTGFVVTHIGLLIILAGAFVSLRYGDEGQLGVVEGTTSNELVRINDSIVRVQKLDAASGNWKDSRDFPFTHGAFSWHSDDLTKIANTPSYITQVWGDSCSPRDLDCPLSCHGFRLGVSTAQMAGNLDGIVVDEFFHRHNSRFGNSGGDDSGRTQANAAHRSDRSLHHRGNRLFGLVGNRRRSVRTRSKGLSDRQDCLARQASRSDGNRQSFGRPRLVRSRAGNIR